MIFIQSKWLFLIKGAHFKSAEQVNLNMIQGDQEELIEKTLAELGLGELGGVPFVLWVLHSFRSGTG